MESDDDTFENVDSGNESSGDEDFPMDVDMNNSRERQSEPEEYPYEVLTTEEIVQHMVDCIKDVNTVVEVSAQTYKNIFQYIYNIHKTSQIPFRCCFTDHFYRWSNALSALYSDAIIDNVSYLYIMKNFEYLWTRTRRRTTTTHLHTTTNTKCAKTVESMTHCMHRSGHQKKTHILCLANVCCRRPLSSSLRKNSPVPTCLPICLHQIYFVVAIKPIKTTIINNKAWVRRIEANECHTGLRFLCLAYDFRRRPT